MSRRTRNFGDHRVVLDSNNHRVIIKPRYINASVTKSFGLGNAVIKINTSNPPKKIVQPITGETDMKGLLPTDVFGFGKWINIPANVTITKKRVTGYNGYSLDIVYPEANNTTIKNLMKDSAVATNGWGFRRLKKFERMEN